MKHPLRSAGAAFRPGRRILLPALLAMAFMAAVAALPASATAATGTIAGTVTDMDGLPIRSITVAVYPEGSQWTVASGYAGPDGGYSVAGLAPGRYHLKFNDWAWGKYVSEFFDDKPTRETADVVTVVGGQTTTADARLSEYGSISGTVTGPGGALLADALVYVEDADGGYVSEARVKRDDGTYTVERVPTGDYAVHFVDVTGQYAFEYYNDAADRAHATLVHATNELDTPNINAQLSIAGRIEGTVTGPGEAPLEGYEVVAYSFADNNEWVDSCSTNAAGQYTLNGLATGKYIVQFETGYLSDYWPEFYNDKPDRASADKVEVTAGSPTTGINARLLKSGTVSGKVTDTGSTPTPLMGVEVTAYSFAGRWLGDATTDADGNYTLTRLKPGEIKVRFVDHSRTYAPEYYDDEPSLIDGDPVTVEDGGATTGINAQLAEAGHLAGTVTKQGDVALEDIQVAAYDFNGDWVYDATTDATGHYDIGGLAAGNYRLRFRDRRGVYGTEFYNNKASLKSADAVAVDSGETTDVDAELAPAGHISGTVTDGVSGLTGIEVNVYTFDGDWVDYVTTGAAGAFDVGGLGAGNYKLLFYDWNGTWATEYYDDKPNLDLADEITVTAGGTALDKGADLVKAGQISGTVTDEQSKPVRGTWVSAYTFSGDWVQDTSTSASGGYALVRLKPGDYKLSFASTQGGTPREWYDDQPTKDAATAVTVTSAQPTSGIDAQLGAPPKIKSLTSSTHGDPNAWYASPNPAFSWTASGLATGYSWTLDQTPDTVPDTTSEGADTSAAFTGKADGVWYFHVRAVEAPSNWGAAVHRKIQISAAAPVVTSLSSSTHPDAARWYANNAPAFTWTATAGGAGIAGYSWSLDQTAGAAPDQTIDGAGATTSFAGVADGVWYFHVRAADGAGNWGAALEVPVRIDTGKPTPVLSGEVVKRGRRATIAYRLNDPPNGCGKGTVKITVKTTRGKVKTAVTVKGVPTNAKRSWNFVCRLPKGRYVVYMTGTDDAGNAGKKTARASLVVK